MGKEPNPAALVAHRAEWPARAAQLLSGIRAALLFWHEDARAILHVRRADSPWGRCTIWFRDRLRATPEMRHRYEAVKRTLTLLAEAVGEGGSRVQEISIVERSVRELGLAEGRTLPEIHRRAAAAGLRPRPPATAAYLRLSMTDQVSALDTVLSAGRAPSGSLTVAAPRLSDDHEFPAGLYLRVIEGRSWLRGYRCDDEHVWSPDDRFAFRAADANVHQRKPSAWVDSSATRTPKWYASLPPR